VQNSLFEMVQIWRSLELKRIREIPTEGLKDLLDEAVSAKGYECVIWPFQTHKFRIWAQANP
jgi:hypothetical protein